MLQKIRKMMLEKKYFQSTMLFLCLAFCALTSHAGNKQEQIIRYLFVNVSEHIELPTKMSEK